VAFTCKLESLCILSSALLAPLALGYLHAAGCMDYSSREG